jgi:hypothetical protein
MSSAVVNGIVDDLHPLDAHWKLTLVIMSKMMHAYCPEYHPDAMDLLKSIRENKYPVQLL